MNIYNTEEGAHQHTVPISAADFLEVIDCLNKLDLIFKRHNGNNLETIPGKLAKNLVRNLGYSSVEEFFLVNEKVAD